MSLPKRVLQWSPSLLNSSLPTTTLMSALPRVGLPTHTVVAEG
jgi:hypothetical protein